MLLSIRIHIEHTQHHFMSAKFSLLNALLMLLVTTACSDHDDPTPDKTVRRTILVYAAAYNSLSSSISLDMKEMGNGWMDAGRDADSCRWLVYKTDYKSTQPTLWELKKSHGTTEWVELKTYSPDTLSTQPERLSAVIADAKAIAPAREYGLVLWSHSSGWTPARKTPSKYWFGDDVSQGNDSPFRNMDIPDLAAAIPHDMFNFIWADCCHMGGVEVAFELGDKCKFFVAYPTEVLAEGMPYDMVMPHLLKPRAELEKAAKAFFDYWDGQAGIYRSATVAVVRQQGLNELAAACRELLRGKEAPDASQIQRFHRAATGLGPYYDLLDLCRVYVGGDTNNAGYLRVKETMAKTVTFAATTNIFLEISIDPKRYCGLSSNMYVADGSAANNFYTTLKWYNAVYK